MNRRAFIAELKQRGIYTSQSGVALRLPPHSELPPAITLPP